MLDNIAVMGEHINAGKLRALATLSPTRVEGLTHIPTAAEFGYNEYVGWFGLYAPAKTPNATISQLISWATAAMQAPDAKRKLEPLGLYPAKTCGTDFAAYIRQQSEEFGHIIRETNIKAE
jgi:tripartite-type tricarboxylate transporter receptor subunit TctC